MRFKVKKALYPHGTNNDSWQPMNLIVDDDIPCTEINRHLVLLQISKEKPLTTWLNSDKELIYLSTVS